MTPTFLLGLALLALFGAIGVIFFVLMRPKANTDVLLLKQQMEHLQGNLDASSKLVHQQMSELTKNLSEGSRESTKVLGERLDNAARVVGEVQKSLGRMEEQTKRIFDVGKDIASLNDILRAPKLRGALGETFLGDLLAQILPQERYQLQYRFKNGQIVDAVIRASQGLIAIDSKFPYENFKKILELKDEEEKKSVRRVFLADVKKHIDAIAQKYIVPDEGTLDFAMMFVPAENIYYEIILKNDAAERDLLKYAQDKRIFPVSPNNFYAYLQTIILGFKGLQMQEGIRVVLDNLARIRAEFHKFGDDFALLGKHVSNARNTFDAAEKRFQKLGEKLETLELEEPQELRALP